MIVWEIVTANGELHPVFCFFFFHLCFAHLNLCLGGTSDFEENVLDVHKLGSESQTNAAFVKGNWRTVFFGESWDEAKIASSNITSFGCNASTGSCSSKSFLSELFSAFDSVYISNFLWINL